MGRLLWFDYICINPSNYAFNKWSSPRELLVRRRFAYSRLLCHQLLWGRKIKAVKEKKQYEGRMKQKCSPVCFECPFSVTWQQTATETSAPHDSPANFLMAGLFHTAPWWRRRPRSYDAGGLAWRGAAVACTDRLGLGPIKCWRQKLTAETCRQWKHAAQL